MLCEAEFATQEELEGHQLSCGGADPITVTCIKCGIAFPEDEIEGHQSNCTFIKCSKCAVIFDGSGSYDTCEDCSYKNEVDKVAEAFCNYIKKYNPDWIVNWNDAMESIYSHLYESKNPVRFFDIFKFCAINQVSSLSLDLAADILKSFPLKIHDSALEKHVRTLPHNRLQSLENSVSLMLYFLYLSA